MTDDRVEGVDLERMAASLDGTRVRYAVLFGSHARGEADAVSDVDVALRFPDDCSARERFDRRNRIDAELQSYADGFVDVSDLQSLPSSVARRALREGIRIVGDEDAVEADRRRLDREYEATEAERAADRRAYVEDLVEGRG